MEVLFRVLEAAGEVDQLNLPSLKSFPARQQESFGVEGGDPNWGFRFRLFRRRPRPWTGATLAPVCRWLRHPLKTWTSSPPESCGEHGARKAYEEQAVSDQVCRTGGQSDLGGGGQQVQPAPGAL